MRPWIVALACFALYYGAYRLYAHYLARKIFALDPARSTPAHQYRDDIDYVPTNRYVLFGHHYASVTGLSPMLGPAVAVIWGWLPAVLWLVLGAVFVGGVHDFGALAVSLRARGTSIGKVAEGLIGHRGKTLFHVIIFFLIALAMGVFVHVVALLFTTDFYPESVVPSGALIVIAVAMGTVIYRHGWSIAPVTLIGFLLMLISLWAGIENPLRGPSLDQWKWLLLVYAFAASVLPVWMLLQPRDWVNSLLLYLGVGAIYAGFFLTRPSFVAPAVELQPEGAPPMFPFIFVIIACGAVSGFHSLVSSGTSAKQLNRETDAPLVGYGSMIGESLLGLLAVLACTSGFRSHGEWLSHYASWETSQGLGSSIGAFVSGTSRFLTALGLPTDLAGTFVAVLIVSFALTSLDSATRLLRYNITEMGETVRIRALGNRYVASAVAVASIWFFAFFEVGGSSAGLVLWQLFGTTNQLLAGLTLLAVTLYLLQRQRPIRYTLLPMLFLLVTTLSAMAINLSQYWRQGILILLFTGGAVFILAIWLAIEAALAVRRYRTGSPVAGVEVEFPPSP